MCQAILSCMILDKAKVNDTFNIALKSHNNERGLSGRARSRWFRQAHRHLPAGLVIPVLKLLEALKLSPLYPWIYETASKDSFVSIEKAQQVLNYKPKYSNKEALLRNYEWYLANKEKFSGAEGVSHRVPWKQKALKLVKIFF